MPPRQIFIVRHGERLDKKDPTFSTKTLRPHDSPLTPSGVAMAETLGEYLQKTLAVSAAHVVILTSPLLRCVQTADGIARGLRGAAATADPTASGPLPAIYIEPALVESAPWQFKDLQSNPEVWREGFFQCPDPLWHSPAYMHGNVSKHVREERPFNFGVAPHIFVKDGRLVEEGFARRCETAGRALANSTDPLFEGRTVICVSHGEASQNWFDAIAADPSSIDKSSNPAYTAFMLLTPTGEGGTAAEPKWVAQLPAFSTPHLPEVPSEY